MTIEHFQNTNIFVRKTEEACISLINETNLEIAKKTGHYNYYNTLRCCLKIKEISMNMNYCRQIFETLFKK